MYLDRYEFKSSLWSRLFTKGMAGPINVPVLLLGPKMGKYGLCLVVS